MLERGARRHPYPNTVRALADALGLSSAEHAALVAAIPKRGAAGSPLAAPSQALPHPGPHHHAVPASSPCPASPAATTPCQARGRTPGLLDPDRGAPGFGKTTLLAGRLSQPASISRHVAWLALDSGDADPLQFLHSLIAAPQTITPSIGATTLPLLQASQPPPLKTLMPSPLNDLVQLPERSILALDNYHVIDAPAVRQALIFLLDHLPPQLRLVIASRADPPLPLSRLRARGQLTELRAHDLHFTPEEAALFLRETMGLALSGEDVAALEARTEGWIAGLQLAALSLRDRQGAQLAEFIGAFTDSNRFVVDYLVDEVLARQPPRVHTVLLQTSILERLSGPPCDAIELDDVLRLLDRMLRQAEAGARGHSVIAILLLLALAMQARGELGAALEKLERAMTRAAPEGYVRIVVDFGAPMAALLRVAQGRGSMPDYVATLLHALRTSSRLEPTPPSPSAD